MMTPQGNQKHVVAKLGDALRAAHVARTAIETHGQYLINSERDRLLHDADRAVQLLARATAYAN